METQPHSRLGPFLALTFIYFLVGFLSTVNGQFQGPLQSAFLSDAGALKNTLITLIPFFFFLAYLVNGVTAQDSCDMRDRLLRYFATCGQEKPLSGSLKRGEKNA